MINSGADIQVDRGEYTRIHNAILERLAEYDFTSREYACILHLLRQTYGFNRKEHKMSYGDFRDATGIDPAHVSRTMKKLVDNNVVIKTDARTKAAATWSFNKYFEQWTIPSRLKIPMKDDAIYCQKSNRLESDSIAERATVLLPKEQEIHAERAIDDCQKSNSYISAKDNIKDNSKDKGKDSAPVAVGPAFSERNTNGYFGMPVPFNSERVVADGYTQDAEKFGVDAATYRAMFDAMIDVAGWRAIVDAGDDRKLNFAKQDALMLIRIDAARNLEQLTRLIAAYRTAYPRKTTYPRDIAEYASQIKAGMTPQAYTNGSNTPVYDSPRKRMKDLTNG